jgi:ABC-type Na+ transport system ATPase subunit NatA
MCDRVIIISKGKIVADDTLSELQAKHPQKSLEEIFRSLTLSVL